MNKDDYIIIFFTGLMLAFWAQLCGGEVRAPIRADEELLKKISPSCAERLPPDGFEIPSEKSIDTSAERGNIKAEEKVEDYE